MKLHSEIINENGAKVSKGGNERLTIGLNKGNRNVATIDFTENEIKIWYEGNHYWRIELQGKQQKSEQHCQYHPKIKLIEGVYCTECSVKGHK